MLSAEPSKIKPISSRDGRFAWRCDGEELIEFYGHILSLPNIQIRGIGTNLNCLSGIMPTQDKLIQLSLYKQLIEAKFNIEIPWVSGGTSSHTANTKKYVLWR
jgi:predicted amino acid racemase